MRNLFNNLNPSICAIITTIFYWYHKSWCCGPLGVLYPQSCWIVHLVFHQIMYILKVYFWQSTKLAATLWWIVECIVCFEIEMSHNGEIVGLHSSSNGRACEHHECFGRAVRLGDLLWLKLVGVVQLQDGSTLRPLSKVSSSRMALRHAQLALSHGMWLQVRGKEGCWLLVGKFTQITELYDQGEFALKKLKSAQNQGVVSYHLLNNIPEQE